jgi:hypothetical protein
MKREKVEENYFNFISVFFFNLVEKKKEKVKETLFF